MCSSVYEELQAILGMEGPPETCPDEVCRAMIRHWCEAVEDANPLYSDDEYASETKYGAIIAPPAMMQAWSMPPLWPKGQELKWRHLEALPKDMLLADPEIAVLQKLDLAGYTGVMATDTSMEFLRPLFLGDRGTSRKKFIAVTPEKQTRAGAGHFVTFMRSYTNQEGEKVCNQRFSVFKFRPTER